MKATRPARVWTVVFVVLGIPRWLPAEKSPAAEVEEAVFVRDGRPLAVRPIGRPWAKGEGYLECAGTGNFLEADKAIGTGDFHVTAELTIKNLSRSAASFVLGRKSHFGFAGGNNKMFVEGPLFRGGARFLETAEDLVTEDEPFVFEAARTGREIEFRIDGKSVFSTATDGAPIGRIALRPWRSTMRVHRFEASGKLIDLPKLPDRTQPDGYTIPTLDISHQTRRQVVVERGTAGKYLGHPTTVLMPDGKTLYCTYPLGHGGPAAVLKRSDDGGRTWSERLPVPDNWATATNCPCIHRLTAPDGTERLFVFEGNGAMRQARSEDGGKTWTPFEPNGLTCIVAPITIVPVAGDKLLAMYHRGPDDRDRHPLTLWQAISDDGGLTWKDERPVAEYPGGSPCEPFVVRSPNGKQLAALARENARKYNALLITSDDEGKTWSKPVELPAALTGDRHMGRDAPDGRLVIAFRDTTHESPTRGDFVAWVGTYDDVVNLREGQYRVRLLRSPKKGDLGYPGVEVLPDGTFVVTTYAVLAPGEKNSVVSVRFKLEELDAEAARLPRQTDVFVSGCDGYHTYRIPSVIVTAKGTVLAFCEGRKTGRGDSGDIDLLLKRSEDGGRTFSEPQIVWDDEGNTCGNPCPVVDCKTGTIWLLMTHNLGSDREPQIVARKSQGTRTVWVSRSDDDGRTWSKPKEITAEVKRPEWSWYATGPGAGIQTRDGRLVVPCDHIADGGEWASHVIYSDDGGKSWKLGGSAPPKTNECEVVELADGRLMLNMRNYDRRHKCRAVATSDDGGLTWSEVAYDEALVEPVCQASIRRHCLPDGTKPGRILFSNPGETDQRKELTVRLSEDEGKTWPRGRVLWPGPAAYSCLAVLPDGTVLCLYERGLRQPYERITLARIALDWLQGDLQVQKPSLKSAPPMASARGRVRTFDDAIRQGRRPSAR